VLHDSPGRLIALLPNRMIVIAQEMPAAPAVSAQVWVKTGSIYEQQHIGAGLSHYLEHLVSGGTTTTRPEAESNAILGRIGASTNAATSLDTVRYYINTTSNHTSEAIALISDWLAHSAIEPKEFEREGKVILSEFQKGLGEPGRILWKLTQQARFTAHPARHPTIGYIDEFKQITRDELYDFYKKMYVPNNMVFVVSGDIDRETVVDQIAELWADVEPGPLPDLAFPVEPELEAPREQSATADINQPRLRLAFPGTQLAEAGDYALDLLGVILGGGESSRLVRTVRDEQRLVDSISAYNLSFAWGRGFFGIDSEVHAPATPEQQAALQHASAFARQETMLEAIDEQKRGPQIEAMKQQGVWVQPPSDEQRQVIESYRAGLTERVEKVREAVREQIEKLIAEGVTDEELARAKRKQLASVTFSGQSAEAQASRLARDMIGNGDPDYLWRYIDALEELTATDVREAAKRFLDPSRQITIKLYPLAPGERVEAIERPAEPEDAGLAMEPIDLDNTKLVQTFRRLDATSRDTAMTISPIQRFELDNGLRVLVQRTTVTPSASIQIYRLGGLLADEPGREGVANAMAAMSIKGTTTRSADEIARTLENLGARMATNSGNNTFYNAARCLKGDLPEVLRLFADVTLNPSFPDEQWQRLQPRLISAIARQQTSWYGELSGHFRAAYFDGHPWSQTPLGRAEVVKQLTADDLKQFHRDTLAAEDAVLAVFGDVDPDAVRQIVEEAFADMPRQAERSLQAPMPPSHSDGAVVHTTDKPLAAAQIGFGPGLKRTDPDYPAVQVLTKIISSFPSGRLEQALRGEGPGLAYAVWAFPFSGRVPGYFGIGFNTQPTTLTEALSRSMRVIKRTREQLPDADTLQRAKAAVLTREVIGKQSNSDRAADAALDELYGLGYEHAENYVERVESLTAEQIREAARKYLQRPLSVVITNEPIEEATVQDAMEGRVGATVE